MTSIREGGSSLWACLRAVIVATLAAAFAPVAPGAAQPVCEDLELAHRLDGEDLLWNDVKAVAGDESRLAALTGSAPVLHLFSLSDGALLGSWGREGEGPGEFQSRTGVALLGGRVYALDGSLGRAGCPSSRPPALWFAPCRSWRPGRPPSCRGAPDDDLLWVRRTPDGRDQIWDVVDLRGQVVGRVSMAPGRTLMAVLPGRVVAKATDDLGTESVEVYRCGT